ncbi:ornithine cyclodeaminase family protein [Ferrimonas balearica]|nr:ornithine cyclodeaminase family protein [Ferrimonas balearica]
MQYFDAEAVHAALRWRGLVEALREAHATQEMPFADARHFDAPDGGGDQFVNLTAWSAGRAVAVKLVGVFPGNPDRQPPEPSVQGLLVLFDGQTGRPILSCDGAALTYRKTAADSALGVDLLARPEAEVLAIAGAGGLAPHVVEAICAVRPIRRLLIWNRTRGRAEAMAEAMARPGLTVEVVDAFTQALPQADIVSTVTMATQPLIDGRCLKPGAHVDLVGAYRPDMREADAETLRRAGRIYADNRPVFALSGDGIDPVAEGLVPGVEADFFDLCAGRHPGRRSDAEITVCKNAGGAHLDLFTAQYLARAIG